MSLYQVQRALFDHLRRLEDVGDGPKPEVQTDQYDLTDDEIRVLRDKDIGALYSMGAHPVIINGYCRALGYKRADYRVLLENSGAVRERKKVRWQTS